MSGGEGNGGIAVGKGVEGICNRVMEDVGECVLYWLGRCWQRWKQLLYGSVLVRYWSSSLVTSPSLNSWTQYIAFN